MNTVTYTPTSVINSISYPVTGMNAVAEHPVINAIPAIEHVEEEADENEPAS